VNNPRWFATQAEMYGVVDYSQKGARSEQQMRTDKKRSMVGYSLSNSRVSFTP